jgi:hypothetical protein
MSVPKGVILVIVLALLLAVITGLVSAYMMGQLTSTIDTRPTTLNQSRCMPCEVQRHVTARLEVKQG